MKKFTIGREPECDYRINDATGRVSRRHAVLVCRFGGGMKIYDLSSHGTWVNDVRVPKPEPLPVRRGDKIRLGEKLTFDWNRFPDPYKGARRLLIGILVGVLVLAAAVGGLLAERYLNPPIEPVRQAEIMQTAKPMPADTATDIKKK